MDTWVEKAAASVPPGVPTRRRGQLGVFVSVMATASVLGLAKGVIFAKTLGAEQFGYYGLLLLVVPFGVYASNLGILNTLNYRLPIVLGRGEQAVEEMIDRSLGSMLIACGLVGLVYLGAVTVLDPADPDAQFALSIAALTTIVTAVSEFYFLLLRVRRHIVPLSALYVLRASLGIVLGVLAGIAWGYKGVIFSEILAVLLTTALAHVCWARTVRVRAPDRRETTRLIATGFPLMLSNVIVAATLMLDRVFVANAVPQQFGQYVFATLVVVAWVAIEAMLNQAVAPQLLYEHGTGVSLRRVRARASRIVAVIGVISVGGFVALTILVSWLSEDLFANYAAGLDVMPVLYVGGVISLLGFPGFILGVLKPSYATAAAAAGALVAVVGGVLIAAGEPTLADFAWLFVASQVTRTVTLHLGIEMSFRRSHVKNA